MYFGQLVIIQRCQCAGDVFIDDLAVGDHDRAVGAGSTSFIVGHHDDRLAFGHQPCEEFENALGRARVEIACGLVGDDQSGIVGQRSGNGDALLLAAGNGRRQLVRLSRHFYHFQQRHGPFAPAGGRNQAVDIHRQHDVLEKRQGRQQLEKLKDDAHVAPAPPGHLLLVECVKRIAVDVDLAGGRSIDARKQVDERRLAAPRLADNGHKLAAPDLQINALDRRKVAGGRLKHFYQLSRVDKGSGCRLGRGSFRMVWSDSLCTHADRITASGRSDYGSAAEISPDCRGGLLPAGSLV